MLRAKVPVGCTLSTRGAERVTKKKVTNRFREHYAPSHFAKSPNTVLTCERMQRICGEVAMEWDLASLQRLGRVSPSETVARRLRPSQTKKPQKLFVFAELHSRRSHDAAHRLDCATTRCAPTKSDLAPQRGRQEE